MNIVLGTHGSLGSALKEAVDMVYGPMEITVVSLTPDLSFDAFVEKATAVLDGLEGEVLVLVDLFGGTPSNVFTALSARYGCEVVAGVNLPALINLCARVNASSCPPLNDLVQCVLDAIGDSAVHTNAPTA